MIGMGLKGGISQQTPPVIVAYSIANAQSKPKVPIEIGLLHLQFGEAFDRVAQSFFVGAPIQPRSFDKKMGMGFHKEKQYAKMEENEFAHGKIMNVPIIFCICFSLLAQQQIGKKIFQNECSGKEEKLVWWNEGENFASLGIGHFIWYPKGQTGPFEETFPAFLDYLKTKNIAFSDWLSDGCPWHSKQECFSKGAKRKELQALLVKTIDLQSAFIIERFEQTIPKRFSGELFEKIEKVGQTLEGKYALVDYLNFKGDGLSEKERYNGQGWGLKQVLEEMQEGDPLKSFADAAKTVLKRRVKNAPHEERWLPGWLSRIDTYLKS